MAGWEQQADRQHRTRSPSGVGDASAADRGSAVTGWLLEVVGPLLAILMISSVVMFLVEVFYRGPQTGRLCWILGLFSAASVLVSRIAIESGRERSVLFMIPLAIATFYVGVMLVEGGAVFAPALAGLIALVLWAADRLTWDCTVIDSSRDSSATGLLELARQRLRGKMGDGEKKNVPDDTAVAGADKADDPHAEDRKGNLVAALLGFGKGRNSPGLWVLWCGLAGLAIFGVGQLFISSHEGWGYGWAALLFAVFVASTLALMSMTSLLGLERYLLRRGIRMPGDLPRQWMTVGTTLALVALLMVLVIPRPRLSGSLESAAAWLTSRPRDASQWGWGRDGNRSGDNPSSSTLRPVEGSPPGNSSSSRNLPRQSDTRKPAGQNDPGTGNAASESGAPPGEAPSGTRSNGPAGQSSPSGGRSGAGGQTGSGQSVGGQQTQSGPQSQSGSARQQNPANGSGQPNGQSANRQQEGSRNDSASQPSDGGSRQPQRAGDPDSRPAGDQADGDQQGNQEGRQTNQETGSQPGSPQAGARSGETPNTGDDPARSSPLRETNRRSNRADGEPESNDARRNPDSTRSQSGNAGREERPSQNNSAARTAEPSSGSGGSGWMGAALTGMIRWFAWIVGLAALALLAWMFREEIRKLLDELRAWLDNFFGKDGQRQTSTTADTAASEPIRRPVRFTEIHNPFRDANVRQVDAAELARRSMMALEALARELDVVRSDDATPHEFASDLGKQVKPLAQAAGAIAEAYAGVAYGRRRMTEKQLELLQQAWQQMEQVARQIRPAAAAASG